MLSSLAHMSLLALFPLAMAAPALEVAVGILPSAVETVDWVAFKWNSKTIYVNSKALIDTSSNTAAVLTRGIGVDSCGASTFNSHDPPYPQTSDCEVIRDCMY